MKIVSALAGFLLFSAALCAQKKETREVSGFAALNVSSAIKVVLTMEDKESLVIEAREDVIGKIKSRVKNGELQLYTEGEIRDGGNMTAYVSAKQLNKLETDGASAIKLTNVLKGDKLEIESSGAADLDLDIQVKSFEADLDGASHVEIKGYTYTAKLDLSGAVDFNGSSFSANEMNVKAAGACKAKVVAKQHIKVDAQGASSVVYSGAPKEKEIYATGASSVKAR